MFATAIVAELPLQIKLNESPPSKAELDDLLQEFENVSSWEFIEQRTHRPFRRYGVGLLRKVIFDDVVRFVANGNIRLPVLVTGQHQVLTDFLPVARPEDDPEFCELTLKFNDLIKGS